MVLEEEGDFAAAVAAAASASISARGRSTLRMATIPALRLRPLGYSTGD